MNSYSSTDVSIAVLYVNIVNLHTTHASNSNKRGWLFFSKFILEFTEFIPYREVQWRKDARYCCTNIIDSVILPTSDRKSACLVSSSDSRPNPAGRNNCIPRKFTGIHDKIRSSFDEKWEFFSFSL
jgi:hypothetical protein